MPLLNPSTNENSPLAKGDNHFYCLLKPGPWVLRCETIGARSYIFTIHTSNTSKNYPMKSFSIYENETRKSRDTSNDKIGHFLASLFADSVPFTYDISWFMGILTRIGAKVFVNNVQWCDQMMLYAIHISG
jgi:hypothetical protein